jgi:hypothetical protein
VPRYAPAVANVDRFINSFLFIAVDLTYVLILFISIPLF